MTARGKMVERVCKGCGVKFLAREADVRRGWAKYHDKSCKAREQEKRTGQFANLKAVECEDPADDMYWGSKDY